MFTTREVVTILRQVNPGIPIDDYSIRSAIRYSNIEPPRRFAGAYAWTGQDIARLCFELDWDCPTKLHLQSLK